MPGEEGRGKLSSVDRLREEDRKAVEKEYMGLRGCMPQAWPLDLNQITLIHRTGLQNPQYLSKEGSCLLEHEFTITLNGMGLVWNVVLDV